MSSTCDPVAVDGNVGLAFGLVTAAGLSTTIGAALAFFMPYSNSSKNLFLAVSLAIAAGVMIYVSFVEIFATKALDAFSACLDRRFAYLYATLCFFGGIFLTYLFDQGLHLVEHWLGRRKGKHAATKQSSGDQEVSTGNTTPSTDIDTEAEPQPHDVEGQQRTVNAVHECVDPNIEHARTSETPADDPIEIDHEVGHDGHMVASIYENHGHDSKALIRMGIFAGIALGFHNFPEGLATFIAVLEDPAVGASVAVAIAIHNIPEGICVALPIYYATGSRKKAFFWATLSGMTELVGAFLGWIVLRKVFDQIVYGVLFGVVAGMMVYISLKELLPTAHRYDPEDQVTTFGLIAGMAVMAVSLVLFEF